MKPQVEILSPAGSYESLAAAIGAGADAVYIGGLRFGARAFADNLTEEKMLEAIDYVHLYGKKIYLTVNTLLKEKEIQEELYDYLLPYYKQGIDAVIVQDMGVLTFIKKHFPDLPIHASTQMTITNVDGARLLEELGVERVVTSRELQLDEIRQIAKNTKLEIESFVHGALCYCYSGQCLYSSLIGGRSGNRGQCAQPCRLPYRLKDQKDTSYLLSLKDICTLDLIPELIDAGIYSFKIEGRMKKPEYVALVTAMYRKYVDLYLERGKSAYCVDSKDKQNLLDLYNRGGFHEGYYHTRNGREMVSIERPNHAGVKALQVVGQNGKNVRAKALIKLHRGDVIELPSKETYTVSESVESGNIITMMLRGKEKVEPKQFLFRTRNEMLIKEIGDTIIQKKKQANICGICKLSSTENARLILTNGQVTVEVTGAVFEKALNQPTSKERIETQLRKTGNTAFVLSELEIHMDEALFVPMQELNELRRNGIKALEEAIVSTYRRSGQVPITFSSNDNRNLNSKMDIYASVETLEQFEIVCKQPSIKRIYADCNMLPMIWKNDNIYMLIEQAHRSGKEIYLAMPHIFRNATKELYSKSYGTLINMAWDGMLIRNIESYVFLQEHGYEKPIVADHHIYQFNRYSKEFWTKKGISSMTASLELNYRELQEVGLTDSELVVYGYLPMMVSAQCVVHTTKGCTKQKETLYIKDRMQKKLAVKNKCDYCYNMIYNTEPLSLLDQKDEIVSLAPNAIRLSFTTEDKKATEYIVQLFADGFANNCLVEQADFAFTRGHFKRGIK